VEESNNMANAVLDIANKLYEKAGLTPPWAKNGGTGGKEFPHVQTTGGALSGGKASSKSDVYSSNKNPSKKAGFPVYTPYDGGYAVDYDIPYAEMTNNESTGIDSKSNKSTQGNNAETVGNISDDTKRIVGNFLDKNIFGGLANAANPGASLS